MLKSINKTIKVYESARNSSSTKTKTKSESKPKSKNNSTLQNFNKIIKNSIITDKSTRSIFNIKKPIHDQCQKTPNKLSLDYHEKSIGRWAIFNYRSGKYVKGHQSYDKVKLVAYSKLGLFLVVSDIIAKYQLDIDDFRVTYASSYKEEVEKLMNHRFSRCLMRGNDEICLRDMLYMIIFQYSCQYELILALNLGEYLFKSNHNQSLADIGEKMSETYLRCYFNNLKKVFWQLGISIEQGQNEREWLTTESKQCNARQIGILAIQCFKMTLFQQILNTKRVQISIGNLDQQQRTYIRNIVITNKSDNYSPYKSKEICKERNYFMQPVSIVYYQKDHQQPLLLVLLSTHDQGNRQNEIKTIIQNFYQQKLQKLQKLPKYEPTQGPLFINTQYKQKKAYGQAIKDKKQRSKSSEKLPYLQTKERKQTVFTSIKQAIQKHNHSQSHQLSKVHGVRRVNTTINDVPSSNQSPSRRFPTELETIIEEKLEIRPKRKSNKRETKGK